MHEDPAADVVADALVDAVLAAGRVEPEDDREDQRGRDQEHSAEGDGHGFDALKRSRRAKGGELALSGVGFLVARSA